MPAANNHALQWIHIDDFSPGIYSNTFANTLPFGLPVVAAPMGAAQPAKTYSCSSLKGGGLGPLPGRFVSLPFATGSYPGTSTSAVITGMTMIPGLANNQFEMVLTLEADDGTSHYVQGWSITNPRGLGAFNAISNVTNTSSTVAGYFGAPYPAFTRMTASGSGNPPPVLVFPGAVSTDASGNNGHLWVYPTLASPGSYSAQDLIVAASSTTGQTICYGNRVICLVGLNYTHPAGGGISTNENINYTNPPQSSTYGNQQTLLGTEIPWGYGAWGTMSVGELLLVKKQGGGIILNGDINTPTSVIPMPGIQPVGNMVGRAASTPVGLVYCSEYDGAWIWNGGNTSQKISNNIDDDFFDMENNVIQSNNYGFFAEHWQDRIMFSNNWMYNTETGGWWIFFPQTNQTPSTIANASFFWWQPMANGDIYASPLKLTKGAAGQFWYFVFNSQSASSEWSWQSVPIHVVPEADRVVDVRQVVLRCSSPDGDLTSTVQATVGSWTATSSVQIGTLPTIVRFNAGGAADGLEDIELTLLAINGNGNSAPILHSIDIGYRTRAKVAVND